MVDWSAIAALLAERCDRPLAVIDRLGRIAFVNTPWEQAFRCRKHEVLDQPLTTFAPPERVEVMGQWLLQAWRGTIRQAKCELVASDGRRLAIAFDVARVGSGSGQSLLVSIESLTEVHLGVSATNSSDVDYKISAAVGAFGVVQEVAYVGRVISTDTQQTCFQLFHRRTHPCSDCPVLAEPTRSWPRTAVRRSAARTDSFEVITAEANDDGTVRVSVRVISDRALEAIQSQRTDALASRARLTDREREILAYLLIGCSLDDIASSLNLSRRTVKFHQCNILHKLGADSRTDLIRLFSF